MQLEFIDVLTTVIALVILVIPGFLLAKTKVLPEKADSVVSNIVLYGCQPVMLFMSFQNKEFSSELAVNMLIVAAGAAAVHLIMIGFRDLSITQHAMMPGRHTRQQSRTGRRTAWR